MVERRRQDDVGLHGQHLRPALAKPPFRLLQRIRLDVGDDHLHPLGREGSAIA
ncbi:MAG TPA: hypothetical protein VNG93_06590 [Candidatus Dormibacteraeota bacterium]|nr:hypothetical protein [Candidatus Dormibacteraeota bacterium]